MSQELIEKAGEIIRQNTTPFMKDDPGPFCVLATIDENGYPKASTITPAKSEGIRWIAFCTGLGSGKSKRIEKCNRAGVCFNTGGAFNISLMGTVEILTDAKTKHEYWYDGLENHFSGPDDPGFCVLMFRTDRYSLMIDWKDAEGAL